MGWLKAAPVSVGLQQQPAAGITPVLAMGLVRKGMDLF